jgi:hypothetical protein
MAISKNDKSRFARDVDKHARVVGLQMANWIADTRRVTELVAGGDTDLVPVFWIRLYGTLVDISDYLAKQADADPRAQGEAGLSDARARSVASRPFRA